MNRYAISLTITNEENNEQFIQLHTVHMTGKQVHDLVGISVEGVLVEPEPPVLTVPKSKKRLKTFLKRDYTKSYPYKAEPKGSEDA